MLVKIGNEYLEYIIISANCVQITDTKKIIIPILKLNGGVCSIKDISTCQAAMLQPKKQ